MHIRKKHRSQICGLCFLFVSVFWCFDVEIVFHKIDETAFDVGETIAILDGHAVGDLDAAVADGDDLEIKAFVAEHFAEIASFL